MNKDTAEARGKQSLAVECLRTLYSVGDLPGLRDRVHNNRVSISRTGCDVDSTLPIRAESDATGGLCSTCHNPIHKAVIETVVLVSTDRGDVGQQQGAAIEGCQECHCPGFRINRHTH